MTLASPTEGIFQVSISSLSTAVKGDEFTADILVENIDSDDGEKDVALHVNGEKKDEKSVSLDGDSSKTVTLSWDNVESTGSHDVTVKSPDDSSTSVVEAVEPAKFGTSIISAPSSATAGLSAKIHSIVFNYGAKEDTKTVTLEVEQK